MRNEVPIDVTIPIREPGKTEVGELAHPIVEHMRHVGPNPVMSDHVTALAFAQRDALRAHGVGRLLSTRPGALFVP